MESYQIKGVDSTIRETKGELDENTSFTVSEKIMTHGTQFAKTEFNVELNGENSSTKVTSRSVATENSCSAQAYTPIFFPSQIKV